ncbi:sugar ABC transporter substrate-binding protein [Lichenicoccus roseus]|uniref:Sugar ABC transporter substrate-binding protein n=1 Tax=Lichenicoccus roseus TaxID=2683649 RepID=A0A5R9JBL0_9PROT|nr:sugar ABC transporter substrate-binding protein [Lichenicoccus roseus]TLU74379.1 sugar ABC transporter substrate-binding protein [Lichenicoccus roseus]
MKKSLLAAACVLAVTAAPAVAKPLSIGVSMALFDDNFLTTVRQAMATHAQSIQGLQVQFQDAQGDVGKQLSEVQNFISQKVDAIIVNPVDTATTKRMTSAATAAHIPIVYVNRRPDETSLPASVAVVASDDKLAGRLQMTVLAKKMGGRGNLVIMLGDLANNSTQGRTAGVKEVLAKYPGIKIVEEQTANWERTKAIDLMNNWITKGDKITGIASNNDEMALGAIIALHSNGVDPKSLAIGGVDATADGLDALRKGDLTVTVFQNAKGQGAEAVDDAVKLANGQAVKQYDTIPYELVTPQNYKSFLNR